MDAPKQNFYSQNIQNRETKLKLAIIGTRGIPAKYGGFETLVEFLVVYLSSKIDITVFCSKEQQPKLQEYHNAHLSFLPFGANGLQGIVYDSIAILKAYKRYDKILILVFCPKHIDMIVFLCYIFMYENRNKTKYHRRRTGSPEKISGFR